ncbi:MAG: hypothetical protein JJT75_15055 [Opitutales bacterium]|nr:hypothetical protein [Opitutales bacterium]
MQGKISPNLHFLHRTDALASILDCPIKDLDQYLGCSWRTIIASRKEGTPISRKTWRKLEAAELKAGLDPPQSPGAEYKKLIADLSASGQQRVKDPDLMHEWVLLLEAAVDLAARGEREEFREVLQECKKAEKRGRPAFSRIYRRESEMSEYMHLFEDLMRKLKPDYDDPPKKEKTAS